SHEYTHTHTHARAAMQLSKLVSILAVCGLTSAASLYSGRSKGEQGSNEEVLQQLLRSFDGFKHDVKDHTGDGTYSFVYHVGDSEREETRSESGEVTGRFAFVAPEGNEIEAKYEADEEGFRLRVMPFLLLQKTLMMSKQPKKSSLKLTKRPQRLQRLLGLTNMRNTKKILMRNLVKNHQRNQAKRIVLKNPVKNPVKKIPM
ncbi:unnamed protein product, partial [Meganyctiphanes norvegica]